MANQKLESLLQEVKQLKENLESIEQSVTLINSILLQQQLEDEAKKLQKIQHQQLEDEASYKCSNCPPIETPFSCNNSPEPQEPHFEESDDLGNSAKYGVEW